MTNILVFGSCRLNFNLSKYNLNRPKNITYIHNHNEILNIIDNLKESNYDYNILSSYSKLSKLNEDTKNSLFKQIESSDIILLEICSKRTFYEYENNEYKIVSRIYEYFDTYESNLENCDFIKFGNTSQIRDTQIENTFIRRDNIKLFDKELFNYIKIGNYLSNKEFSNIIYNQDNKNTIIKIINMPNNYFKTFNISFDIAFIKERLFTVKLDIKCNFTKNIYIKFYNGKEYIYTDQKVNDKIILDNFKDNYLIGFYTKNDMNKIMTSDMLKETNEFYWNFNLIVESYEIIFNELDEIDNTLPKNCYIYKESETEFINNFNDFLNHFDNKKIVVIPNLATKDNFIKERLFTVKLDIKCNFTKNIYIKFYNGKEYIYTDQKVNDKIILDNFKDDYLIGFYTKNDMNKIMTSDMLTETNEFYWNFNLIVESYEIIFNELDERDNIKLFDKELFNYIKIGNYLNNKEFINIIYNQDNKNTIIKIINMPNNYFKTFSISFDISFDIDNEEIIPNYVNNSRLKYINFLKDTLSEIPNCYFFENYVTNNLLNDENHYNESGYKIVGEKLEKFLDEL